jgi:DNA-binding response OmpR family regulator
MLGKILLLENDIHVEYIVKMILEDDGFFVLTTTYTSVLQDASTSQPDLVILSPRLRSYFEIRTLCENLRFESKTEELPIIFLSARRNLEDFAIQCNASAYISKTFYIDDLCNTVKDILSL